MEIKVNKEVRDYTESIFLGLSFRQFLFSIMACVVAVIIYLSCVDILGMETTSWLCMLGAAPFASLGFITFQKMNAEQILITAWHSFLLSNKNLIDKPFNLYYEMFKDIFDKQIKEALGKNDKKLCKIKKTKQRKI
ncbi:PrgI family protein [Coprobacillus sp. AM18-4LB-d2]|nr:PrgI family protein [Coprobacillus sp. AM18-4LB-d2]